MGSLETAGRTPVCSRGSSGPVKGVSSVLDSSHPSKLQRYRTEKAVGLCEPAQSAEFLI